MRRGADTPRLAATNHFCKPRNCFSVSREAGAISHKTILDKWYFSGALCAEPQLPSELNMSFVAVLYPCTRQSQARQGRLCMTHLAKLCLEKVASFIMEEVASFIIHDQKEFRF